MTPKKLRILTSPWMWSASIVGAALHLVPFESVLYPLVLGVVVLLAFCGGVWAVTHV